MIFKVDYRPGSKKSKFDTVILRLPALMRRRYLNKATKFMNTGFYHKTTFQLIDDEKTTFKLTGSEDTRFCMGSCGRDQGCLSPEARSP